MLWIILQMKRDHYSGLFYLGENKMEDTKNKVLEGAIPLTQQACFCMMTPDEPSSALLYRSRIV